MKITLISFDNWDLNDSIAKALEKENHIVKHIDFSKFIYKYPSTFHRIYNFFLKAFFKQNLKTKFYGKSVLEELDKNKKQQDLILTIKGDFIAPEFAKQIKNYTKKSIAFFNDNTKRCPKIIRVLSSFDEAFSFEKQDCIKYNLKFAPNWIYDYTGNPLKKSFDYQAFNISSKDKRLPILSRIANELKSKKINYKIIVYDKKNKKKDNNIEYITEHIPLPQVKTQIENAQVLLDVNRQGQEGLTFRVLESLGWSKKLITTNSDVINYDFYNPNNILIINEKKPNIPVSFFEKEYEEIPDAIFNKYTLDGWIGNVIYDTLR